MRLARFRPRVTVARLMIAVAVVGLLCGGEICRQRYRAYTTRTNLHTLKQIYYHNAYRRHLAWSFDPDVVIQAASKSRQAAGKRPLPASMTSPRAVARMRAVAEKARLAMPTEAARAEYHGRMKDKYEAAARHPWLAVAPDPPEPR